MIKIIQNLTFCIILTSCTLTYQPRPDTFKIEPITEFSSPVTISIINVQPDNVDRIHLTTDLGSTISGSMKSWTDTAIAITNRELTARGATLLDNAPRKLELAVISIEGETSFSAFRYKTQLKVKTGSGYEATYIGDNQSPATVYRAADGAVMRAVSAMLKDPVIVKYITSINPLTTYKPDDYNISPYRSLEELKTLFDKGVLTENEYTAKKREILKNIK